MTELFNKSDFDWYKKELDVEGRYEYDHFGEPKEYPCKVTSYFSDPDHKDYRFDHKFVYKQETCCSSCGHKELEYKQ